MLFFYLNLFVVVVGIFYSFLSRLSHPIHPNTPFAIPTASFVVYVERTDGQRLLLCANVGDSDVILIPQNPHEWKRLSEVRSISLLFSLSVFFDLIESHLIDHFFS
jgi:hypothetical protein